MRYRLAFLLIVVLAANCWAQSGGLINGTRGIPQPNEGTTGTTLNLTATVNSAGQAILATTTNTTVPVRIVVGGAGTTGNAVLASTGTLAPCTMDATVASGAGAYYVLQSTTTNGQCHPQSTAPAAGTWVIGYLHDSATTSGSTALVHVNGFIYGGSGGGGSGTVSPNNGAIITPLAAYPAAGGSTTVQPALQAATSTSGNGGLLVTSLQFASSITASPEIAFQRLGSYTMGLGTTAAPGSASVTLRTGNPCASGTADISFTTTAGTFCSKNIPTVSPAQNWVVHCVIPWGFSAGSGTANVALGVSLGSVPTTSSTWTGILWGTGTGPVYQSVLMSSNGQQPVVTTTGQTIAIGTIYSATIDGVLSYNTTTAFSFSFYATTSNGTGVIKAGAYCVVE